MGPNPGAGPSAQQQGLSVSQRSRKDDLNRELIIHMMIPRKMKVLSCSQSVLQRGGECKSWQVAAQLQTDIVFVP